jgi:hypothetical protein
VTSSSAQPDAQVLARLARVNTPAELRAAILALLSPPDSAPSYVAWSAETSDCAQAALLREDVMQLGDAMRLPCFEIYLERMRRQPIDERRALLESTRRVVAALSPMRPLDRLHWLLMRRRLSDRAPASRPSDERADLAGLPAMAIVRIASVAAYVARMVPGATSAEAQRWYQMAMAPVVTPEGMPPCHAPDGDGLARALGELEALPWMLRPVLMRAWVIAALANSQRSRLRAGAADALRLVSGLLDTPLAPELARHYVELNWSAQAAG